MSSLGWLAVIVMLAQGAFMALTPGRAIRYTVWKTRLIGAHVAEPGRGTLIFFGIQGIAVLLVALFVLSQLIPE